MYIHLTYRNGPVLQLALPLRPVFLRAGLAALVIGVVLNLVNQGEAIAIGEADSLMAALFFTTPFITVVISQLTALRAAWRDHVRQSTASPIPAMLARSALVGLIMASSNAAILLLAELTDGAPVALPSIDLLCQAFLLPTLFSGLSQLIAYRRQRKALSRPS